MQSIMKLVRVLGACTILLAICSSAFAQSTRPDLPYVENEILVKFAPGVKSAMAESVLKNAGAVQVKEFRRIGFGLVKLNNMSVEEAIDRFKSDPRVEIVEPNYIYSSSATPDDPSFDDLWGMHNTGQTGGTPDADIDAVEAWDLIPAPPTSWSRSSTRAWTTSTPTWSTTCGPTRARFPATASTTTTTARSTTSTATISSTVTPTPWTTTATDPLLGHHRRRGQQRDRRGGRRLGRHHHGPEVPVVRRLGIDGRRHLLCRIRHHHGRRHHEQQLGRRRPFETVLETAIADANAAGIFFVAAAGNNGSDNDVQPHYPSSYEVPNVIAVMATNHTDESCGHRLVDLQHRRHLRRHRAPRAAHLITTPGNTYADYCGTSMATPHVAGAIGLVKSVYPGITVAGLKDLVINSADDKSQLQGIWVSNGRLNVASMLAGQDTIPPSEVTDLATLEHASDRISLTWTSPRGRRCHRQADFYDIGTAPRPSMRAISTWPRK